MKKLRLDLPSGIAGDMFLGMLIDLGADIGFLQKIVRAVAGNSADLKAKKVLKNGIEAVKATILFNDRPADECEELSISRNFSSIKEIIEKSEFSKKASKMALRAFEALFSSEAKVHGKSVEDIHLHEAGAIDALGEICASAVAIELLEIDSIVHGPIPIPYGSVKCAHGVYPNPAPAVLELLTGRKIYSVEQKFELVTPTGAAILSAWAVDDSNAEMKLLRIGYGAGTMELPQANVLRGSLLEKTHSSEKVMILESNLDDVTPEVIGFLIDKLMQAGALDVSVAPVIMKKNRPGHLIRVIAEPSMKENLSEIIFSETGTLGIRFREENRIFLERKVETVNTEYGYVKVVSSKYGAKPEFEDCKKIAEEKGIPLKKVEASALASILHFNIKD